VTIEPTRVAEIMGGSQVLGHSVRSLQDLSHAVLRGLPKDALKRTVRRVFPEAAEANEIMNRIVPSATYKRRRNTLKVDESERTERLARIIASAEYVWADAGKARHWLTKPHPELGRKSPVDLALSELGARQVEDLLDRIFYGLPV
jgi:putative toxin-antitoxin system antitoxin component (TIGR02293 family)